MIATANTTQTCDSSGDWLKAAFNRPNLPGLPIPTFFDPQSVEGRWRVQYEARLIDAIDWRTQHNIAPASQDRFRVAFMPIDNQISFCHPDGALFVAGQSGRGALDDTVRTAEFIYRNLPFITTIIPTMDTHIAFQISHPMFWVNDRGEHPAGATIITLEEVNQGKWRVNPEAAYAIFGDPEKQEYLEKYATHYVQTLTAGGKYPLMIWPHHAMLGDVDHALMPLLQEAVFFHSAVRKYQTDYQQKGDNPLTENYSPLKPEVLLDHEGGIIASKNSTLLMTLLKYDALIITGQAKSHCLAWAIDDLLAEIQAIDPSLVDKIYIVEDLTSPVVIPAYDFSEAADAAFERFKKAGMHIVKSTTPMAEWPGMQAVAA